MNPARLAGGRIESGGSFRLSLVVGVLYIGAAFPEDRPARTILPSGGHRSAWTACALGAGDRFRSDDAVILRHLENCAEAGPDALLFVGWPPPPATAPAWDSGAEVSPPQVCAPPFVHLIVRLSPMSAG